MKSYRNDLMDKRGTQGKNKLLRGEQKLQPCSESQSSHVHNFKADSKEFPSLSEVFGKSRINQKENFETNKAAFTYSDKLKSSVSKQIPSISVPSNKSEKPPQIVSQDNDAESIPSRKCATPVKKQSAENGRFSEEKEKQIFNKKPITNSIKSNLSSPRKNFSDNKSSKINSVQNGAGVHVSRDVQRCATTGNSRHSEISENPGAKEPEKNYRQEKNQNLIAKYKKTAQNAESVKCRKDGELDLVKTKKKRKSKMKRQVALQSGKITLLTAEAHSKILSQSNSGNFRQHKNILTNINDSEEYPELSTTFMSKSNRENQIRNSDSGHKEKITSVPKEDLDLEKISLQKSPKFKPDTEGSSISQEVLHISAGEKTKYKTENKAGNVIHQKTPITVSFFDILLTTKPKAKELKEKDDPSDSCHFTNSRMRKGVRQPHNLLDSSSPAVKRGKERENPRVRKLTQLKKIILMDRKMRKKQDIQLQQCLSTEMAESKATVDDSCSSLNECDVRESFDLNSSSVSESTLDDEVIIHCEMTSETNTCENKSSINHEKACQTCVGNVILSLEPAALEQENDVQPISQSFTVNDVNILKCVCNELSEIEKTSPEKSLDQKYEPYDSNSIGNKCLCQLKKIMTEEFPGTVTQKVKIENESNSEENETAEKINQIQNISDFCEEVLPKSFVDQLKFENQEIIEESYNPEALSSEESIHELSELFDRNMSDCNNQLLFSEKEKMEAVNIAVHTRSFREYCNHLVSKEIDDSVHALLDDLARFQDRMHLKDPVKARMKRRLCYGIKEVKKHLKLRKVKCIIIARDIENVQAEGGLNDILNDLKSLARDHHIPCVFALGRWSLGKVCRKPVPVSCVGVYNYDGSEANFKKMVELQSQAMSDYKEIVNVLTAKLSNSAIIQLFKAKKEAPDTLYDVRTEILRQLFMPNKDQEGNSIWQTVKFICKISDS